MPVTADALISASLIDLGIMQPGDTLSPGNGQQGLRRLNAMVSGWRTQYGTVTSVDRTIFDLIADKQTYTIGPGGDFDVPRPLSIDGAGLWLNGLSGASAVSSITRVGYVATVTSTAHGFTVGDEAYIAGAEQRDYNGLQTVQSVPTASTFTFTVEGTPVTPATGTLTVQSVSGQPVEIPRVVITDSAYQAIQLKNMSNSQFTVVYYNPTYPYGTVFLWPRPNTNANQLVLYLKNVFAGFESLTKAYDFPDLPGYAEALQYNLGMRLGIAFGVASENLVQIREMAMQTLGLIKRSNNKLNDLPSDASMLTHDRRGGYNINTGTAGF